MSSNLKVQEAVLTETMDALFGVHQLNSDVTLSLVMVSSPVGGEMDNHCCCHHGMRKVGLNKKKKKKSDSIKSNINFRAVVVISCIISPKTVRDQVFESWLIHRIRCQNGTYLFVVKCNVTPFGSFLIIME